MKLIIFGLVFGLAQITFAQDAATATFKGESEASAIVISGNSNSETYGAKTKNTWNMTESDLAIVFGKYIQTSAGGNTTNKQWEAGLRYERVIVKEIFNGYLEHKAEHDPFNGVFVQRDSTELGGKYFFTKSDDLTWTGELGYSYSKIYLGSDITGYGNFIRGNTEANYKANASTSVKFLAEYKHNLKDADKSNSKGELSVSVVMTDLLSLKTAFEVVRNEAAVAPNEKQTTTWTTALVAKY
jgi:putative salt-induced outer membrane protein